MTKPADQQDQRQAQQGTRWRICAGRCAAWCRRLPAARGGAAIAPTGTLVPSAIYVPPCPFALRRAATPPEKPVPAPSSRLKSQPLRRRKLAVRAPAMLSGRIWSFARQPLPPQAGGTGWGGIINGISGIRGPEGRAMRVLVDTPAPRPDLDRGGAGRGRGRAALPYRTNPSSSSCAQAMTFGIGWPSRSRASIWLCRARL